MLSLREQIFGDKGYSLDLVLSQSELSVFRDQVSEQWLSVIKSTYPELATEASRLGIENYHTIADRLDHKKLWPKSKRVLPQSAVNKLKSLPFFSTLRQEFGEFTISDVYDTYQHHGEEEIYWRLVRPNVDSDVGPLHADKWFHNSFNMGYGMFPPGVVTVKIWLPLFCEAGKNGLAVVKGSHLKEWKFHVETIEGLPKPMPDDDLTNVDAELILTKPGNMLIFHENTLHGGVVNRGDQTRVSAEITMVMQQPKNLQ